MSKVNADENIWPMPLLSFSVDIGTESGLTKIPFQEVSGLGIEPKLIEYEAENAPRFSTAKMSSLSNSLNVILKKGMFPDGSAFWEFFEKVKMNTISRTAITIKLLDEGGIRQMTWTLTNAGQLQ